ncbi:restriction endonuclease subunit S [Mariniflexile sp.]|uniref:restriction endonuclease subunit S n=1 Tax=Mariniflexile sp. TaxID=1979402 RepID=UPI00356A4333
MREGWKSKKLKEVCDKITDGTHQTPKYFDEGVIFLSSKNVTSGKIDWDNIKYIDEAQHFEMHKRVAPRVGDILLAKNGTTGVAAMVDRDVVFDIYVSLAHIRVLDEITPEYMLYFINSPLAKEQFNSRLKGVGVPNLHLQEIREVKITYPKSLQEQQQIVAILDKAFKAIDQAKANIEKNIDNAKELFQSKLDSVFLKKGDDWEEKKLGEIASVEYGYTDKSTTEGDYRYVRITDIDNNGKLISEDKKYIKYSKEAEKFILKDKDLLMARTGATFAKVLLHNNVEPSVFASYLIRINFQEKIENELYWYFSKSGYYWQQANDLSSGAAQPHFNGAALKQVVFSYPKSIDKQQKLLNIFKGFLTETQEIVQVYDKKLLNLDELKKSILQKAFAGELTNKEVLV